MRYFSAIAPAATRPRVTKKSPLFQSYVLRKTRIGVGRRTNSFARAASATPTTRFYAVFLEVGPISVARSRVEVRLGIIVGSLVLVQDHKSDRCSKRNSLLDPGLYPNEIFLVSLRRKHECALILFREGLYGTYWCGQVTLAWASATQLNLDVLWGELHSLETQLDGLSQAQDTTYRSSGTHRWYTIYDTSDRGTMAFTIGGNTVESSKGRHRRLTCKIWLQERIIEGCPQNLVASESKVRSCFESIQFPISHGRLNWTPIYIEVC